VCLLGGVLRTHSCLQRSVLSTSCSTTASSALLDHTRILVHVLCLAVAGTCISTALSCRDLYADASAEAAAGEGDEPELRRQLRAARAAEKHAKMKAALAEKQAKEAAEAERRQQQQAHKQAHRERIEAWRNKNKVGGWGLLACGNAHACSCRMCNVVHWQRGSSAPAMQLYACRRARVTTGI
jgi:hypothetical protein